MFKKIRFVLICVVCFFIRVICGYAQETLTITTYYPSPEGSYNEIRANRMAIGYTTSDACWTPPCPGTPPGTDISDTATPPRNIDLIVNGAVGIGTVNPVSPLHVHSATSQGHIAISGVSDAGLTYSALYLDDDVATQPWANTWVIGHRRNLGLPEENSFTIGYFGAGGGPSNNPVFINTSGNVGIGTASPTSRLLIRGNNVGGYDYTLGLYSDAVGQSAGIQFALNKADIDNPIVGKVASIGMGTLATHFGEDVQPGDLAMNSRLGNDLHFVTKQDLNGNGVMDVGESLTKMIIKNNGNVGIGTTNPTAKLEVNGITKATGGLIIPVLSADPPSPQVGEIWLRQ